MKELFEQRDCLSQDEIKRYVQGQMKEKEQREMENHLADCQFCSDAVEGYASVENFEQVDQVLEEFALTKQQEQKKAQEAKVVNIQKASASRSSFFLKAAAAILLISIPAALLLYSNANQGPQLFAEMVDEIPATYDYAQRTDDSTKMRQEPFFLALQAYDSKEYAKSLVLFRQHLSERPEDKAAVFFSGVAYLKNGQTKKAIAALEQIYLDTKSGFHLDATWYLALAKLKQNDNKRAKSLLQVLTQTDSYYNGKAAELLVVIK